MKHHPPADMFAGISDPAIMAYHAANADVVSDRAQPRTRDFRQSRLARLQDRLLQNPDALSEAELLELLLHRQDCAGDAASLASNLISHFGDFNRVVTADPSLLTKQLGQEKSIIFALKLIQVAAKRLTRARLLQQPVLSDWQALIDYCHTTLAHSDVEQLHVLYLDRRNALLADEPMGRGTVNHVPVYPREILRRALMLNASALILVHNHPSGDPEPSDADISMTAEIVSAGAILGLCVHDHLIIGKCREVSLRSAGLM